MLASFLRGKGVLAALLSLLLTVSVAGVGFADEQEKRRVDISLSIFPRIVAVDNQFRNKLNKDQQVRLLFVYERDEEYASELAQRMIADNRGIGGMRVVVDVAQVDAAYAAEGQLPPTAIFLTERFSNDHLARVMTYAEEHQRLVFSPFSGDVERGVTVGISVTNRVKPYFNLPILQRTKVDINALLMKMSKRYE